MICGIALLMADLTEYVRFIAQDEAMLFIIIRSADEQFVQKVVEVVHQTIRLRHKAG